jgi:hypothetical protein
MDAVEVLEKERDSSEDGATPPTGLQIATHAILSRVLKVKSSKNSLHINSRKMILC